MLVLFVLETRTIPLPNFKQNRKESYYML